MSTVRVGGFLFGEFSMTRDEFARRCHSALDTSVTIKVVDEEFEYFHIGVVPEFDGDVVRFYCDDTTIWAKRPVPPRSDR